MSVAEAFDRLELIGSYDPSRFDSEGVRVKPEGVAFARSLIEEAVNKGLDVPDVYMVADGSIILGWTSGGRLASLKMFDANGGKVIIMGARSYSDDFTDVESGLAHIINWKEGQA